jgi:hypothetical protein
MRTIGLRAAMANSAALCHSVVCEGGFGEDLVRGFVTSEKSSVRLRDYCLDVIRAIITGGDADEIARLIVEGIFLDVPASDATNDSWRDVDAFATICDFVGHLVATLDTDVTKRLRNAQAGEKVASMATDGNTAERISALRIVEAKLAVMELLGDFVAEKGVDGLVGIMRPDSLEKGTQEAAACPRGRSRGGGLPLAVAPALAALARSAVDPELGPKVGRDVRPAHAALLEHVPMRLEKAQIFGRGPATPTHQ